MTRTLPTILLIVLVLAMRPAAAAEPPRPPDQGCGIVVIPRLDPAIHVDPRVKPGDDDWGIELDSMPL